MNWIRPLSINLIVLMGGLLLFELICFTLLRDTIRRVDSRYADRSELAFGKGYPQDYFHTADGRGFDIKPEARALSRKPVESPPYEVWANGSGCFDHDWPDDRGPEVYLAGDSFTWGYAAFEQKFGTLLEDRIGSTVMKCGVTHTGQQHQLAKFRDIAAQRGRFPRAVIINVTANDIANDFAFPHSRVVGGYLFDDVAVMRTEAGPQLKRLGESEVEAIFQRQQAAFDSFSERMKRVLNRFSATAILLKRLGDIASGNPDVRPVTGVGAGIYDLYAFSGSYPIREGFASANRDALLAWQRDSEDNGYTLLVSPIPSRHLAGTGYFDELEAFLEESGIQAISFEDYLGLNAIDVQDLFWTYDPHFNLQGNAVYATFLSERLGALACEPSSDLFNEGLCRRP